MVTLSKRELAGVLMCITGLAAALLFIDTAVCLWRWKQDSNLAATMEPRAALNGLILAPVFAAASWLFGWLRSKAKPDASAEHALVARPTEWERIRGDLIKTVRSHWIDDYQRHSLYERIRLRLGIEQAPDAIGHPFEIERISRGKTELVSNESLLRLFDDSGGLLLILGAPGSGKTVTLVQLAGLLLDRADRDPDAPVAVVVPLASWAVDRQPLDQWLRAELRHHYSLSARDTPALLAEGKRLTLLLDGLDEVREDARAACLEAIRQFKGTFAADLAVCCRLAEYEALPAKFPHGDAIRILPLAAGQIDAYFAAFRGRLDPLRRSLREHTVLRELAATPLMLNILATIYGSDAQLAEVALSASIEAWRDAIFTRYVRLMFQRKEHKTANGAPVHEAVPFAKGQAIHWLQQIARRMVKGNATTLYMEQMQPAWVTSKWKLGLIFGLILGVILGGILGLMGVLIAGMTGVLIAWLMGVLIALIAGMMGAVIGGLAGTHVELVESIRLKFDPRQLIGGLIVGLIFGLSSGLGGGLTYGLTFGLTFGLIVGLISGLFERRSHPQPAHPNRGLRKSLRMSLLAAVISASFASSVAAVFGYPLALGISGLLLGFISFGGIGVMLHYAIRLTLAWERALPFPFSDRRLVGFLDSMRDRILLTRVGGGWIFIHRLLLEFLAGQPFGATPEAVERSLALLEAGGEAGA